MHQCQNLGPLFLIEANMSYEPHRLINTCTSFEWAVSCAEAHQRDTDRSVYDEQVRIRAVQPGPGEGVVVARWYSEIRPPEGPRAMDHNGWMVEAEGPPTEGSTRWERVL